ncbi:MAG: Fe-S cluster assembly ATPase SufC, partial [Rhodothermaceae bacterium]|nr:Fe-S cluster assembly ATPase SufC [Rhodothermaceae bacterium]
VHYRGEDLLDMDVDERSREGIFLAFQYPVELPGVSMMNFLKQAVNTIREHRGHAPLGAADLLRLAREKAALIGLDPRLKQRSVNQGFSGGEKKRNEIFQLAMLEPTLAVLDETDSGLDIDALRSVARGVNQLRKPTRAFLVITHYQRLLNYIVPDFVHVMVDGRIVRSGGKELALELEKHGYDWVHDEIAA